MTQVPKVIDISHGNTVRDFQALKAAGIVGVIHKATQGTYFKDPLYDQRREQAEAAGLLWGAYCFNTGEDPATQVGVFLAHAAPEANTLVALDFEDNYKSQMSLEQAQNWLERCADALGRKPVLYSGNRAKDLLGDTENEFFGAHRLWLPQYGPHAVVQASWKNAARQPWLWQYSEHGQLPGTDGLIDLNAFAGSDDELTTEWAS